MGTSVKSKSESIDKDNSEYLLSSGNLVSRRMVTEIAGSRVWFDGDASRRPCLESGCWRGVDMGKSEGMVSIQEIRKYSEVVSKKSGSHR